MKTLKNLTNKTCLHPVKSGLKKKLLSQNPRHRMIKVLRDCLPFLNIHS